MIYTVSITSQGQISIPAALRRQLGLDSGKKALVSSSEKGDTLIIKPVKDFLELGGSLRTNIKATPRQIREAFEQYLADEAVKSTQ